MFLSRRYDLRSETQRLTLLDRVFPEYPTLLSDTFGKTSSELLSTYTTPEEILAVDTDKLCEVLATAGRGRFDRQKAEHVKVTAANSFGALLCTDSTAFMLRKSVEQIKFLESQLSELENMISERLASFDTQITSITGIGDVLGVSILSKIGDINRSESPEKLAAFAGIDLSVKQSGQFMGNQNHMSKRWSPYLRCAVWLVTILHDPAIRLSMTRKGPK